MVSMNSFETHIKVTRREICDMLIACNVMGREEETTKWKALHDKLLKQLNDLDAQLEGLLNMEGME